MRTADLWKIHIYFLFSKSILIIISVKCLVKKISEIELDHKVLVLCAMPVVSVASKYEAKNRWVSGQSVKRNAISVAV